MKASKLLLAVSLFTGLATLSLAGPGPQYWTQQAQNQKAQPTKAAAQPTIEPTATVAACGSCACCSGMKKS